MDRFKLLLVLFGSVISMIFAVNNIAIAQESRMYPLTLTPTRIGDTPTPPPAPEPTIAFTTGHGIDTNQSYAPKANSICWTWNHIIGRIGPYSVSSGKQLLVVKFLVDQQSIVMNNVVCEESDTRLPEERASWANNREPWYYPWSKIETYYVGSNLNVITLTPTVLVTNTITPSLSPTISATPTPKAAPPPTYVFYTGDSIDTLQYYAPKKNELCITWNHLIGRIGPFFIPGGKSPLILKFTEDQSSQPMVVVWCENAINHTPEERLSSIIQDQPCCYTWERGVIKYIGANMQEVTLTPTILVTNTLVPTLTSTEVPTETQTSSPTSTSSPTITATRTSTPTRITTSTRTRTRTVVSSLTPTILVTNTLVPTLTSTEVSTETQTSSPTSTSSPTITATRTSTPTRTTTNTRTRTRTVVRSLTPTPVTRPDFEVNNSVSTLYQPDKGDVCFGEVVGNLNKSIVEFLLDYNFGIEIIGGGCFGKNKFSLSEILRYLESRGIRYSYSSLPKPTLTPSRTLVPTATIVSYVHIGIQTDRTKNMILQPGTICWGYKVSNFEYKVVKYHKGTTSPIRITNGGCTLSENLSAEDVYNYLRRRLNLPLNGFVEVR